MCIWIWGKNIASPSYQKVQISNFGLFDVFCWPPPPGGLFPLFVTFFNWKASLSVSCHLIIDLWGSLRKPLSSWVKHIRSVLSNVSYICHFYHCCPVGLCGREVIFVRFLLSPGPTSRKFFQLSTTWLTCTVKGSAPRLQTRQLYSPVYSTGVHTAAPDTAPRLLYLLLLRTTQIHYLIRSSKKILAWASTMQ